MLAHYPCWSTWRDRSLLYIIVLCHRLPTNDSSLISSSSWVHTLQSVCMVVTNHILVYQLLSIVSPPSACSFLFPFLLCYDNPSLSFCADPLTEDPDGKCKIKLSHLNFDREVQYIPLSPIKSWLYHRGSYNAIGKFFTAGWFESLLPRTCLPACLPFIEWAVCCGFSLSSSSQPRYLITATWRQGSCLVWYTSRLCLYLSLWNSLCQHPTLTPLYAAGFAYPSLH